MDEKLRIKTDERLAAELALKASEEKYRSLVNSSLDMTFTLGVDDAITSLNPAFERVTGWKTEEWIGRDCNLLIHPEDRKTQQECRRRILKGEELPPGETRMLVKSGGFRVLEFLCAPLYLAESIVGVIGTARDITERKEIEEKLRKAHDELEIRVRERTEELANANLSLMVEISERKRAEEAQRLNEQRLEALLNLSNVPWTSSKKIALYVLEQELKLTRSETGAIGFLDQEEKVVTWGAGILGQEPFAYTPTEEAGTWADAIKNRRPVIANEVSDIEAAGKGLPFPLAIFRRFMSVPVCEGERTTAVAVVANKGGSYDQSDLRQLTLLMDGMWKIIERERSMKALKDAENLAAIGRALSSVAHDMKTPLVAIGGFAKQIQRHFGAEDPCWVKTEIILKETERLEKMVEDMLDFSKPIELRTSIDQIDAILAESVAVTKPLADAKNIELRIEAIGPTPSLPLDLMRMKRVFINLLTNAIEASPEAQPVRVVHRRLGKDLIVDVCDSGPGIPYEIRKDIFLPFFTTRKGGTGLGLPIVKKVVEAHKGTIEVLSSPWGTTFRLSLPAA